MTTTIVSTPPISAFRDPGLTEPTPLTVTPDGRIYGHLCEWDRAHIAFGGRRVHPPRGDDMRFFLTGATDVIGDAGEVQEISVGKLTMNTSHASTDHGVTADAAARHYDHTGTIAALVNAGTDRVGIWMAGVVLDDLDDLARRRLKACGASGDWRSIEGQLRLVAALSIPVGGFPIPRARVASGAPMALVAAGALAPARPEVAFARRVDPSWRPPSEPLDVDSLADAIAAKLDGRQASARAAQLLTELDENPRRAESLLADLDDNPARAAFLLGELDEGGDEESDFLSRMPGQLKKEWLAGKVAARIRWGTPGDFDRCVAQARKHEVPAAQQKGMCNNLHREATGNAPGKH